MNRAIISQRITSILAEIERLNNALYAMNTTDIQRYPDNYEVLSTDAALRAERITCRLRHLIYATTSIKKEEYLRSAETMQGIEISDNDGILEIKLPCLLPKRRQRQSTEFLLDPFMAKRSFASYATRSSAGRSMQSLQTGSMRGYQIGASRTTPLTARGILFYSPTPVIFLASGVLIPRWSCTE